jgi:hypothetical protein
MCCFMLSELCFHAFDTLPSRSVGPCMAMAVGLVAGVVCATVRAEGIALSWHDIDFWLIM